MPPGRDSAHAVSLHGGRANQVIAFVTCLVVGVGAFLFFRREPRDLTLDLDEGVMACGFRGDPAVLPDSAQERSFPATHLTLQSRGRVLFTGPVEAIECYRSAESRWGLPGGDFIQVALADGPLEPTVAGWERIYRQFGAAPRDLERLAAWAQEVRETERAGRSGRDVWLQGSLLIPETALGVYAQSIPTGSELPLVYGSHFTISWNAPERTP